MKSIIGAAIFLQLGSTTTKPMSGMERDGLTAVQINTVTATVTGIAVGTDTLVRQSNDTFYKIPVIVY